VAATVRRWSGREVRALRHARRMSIREFARNLGVSDRMVSKWEAAGECIHPRPINQEALDTFFARSSPDVQQRFALLVADARQQPSPANAGPASAVLASDGRHVRHPVDGKLMTLVEPGVFLRGRDNEPTWIDAFCIDVFPTTNADYARFAAATGHPSPIHWTGGHCPDHLIDHPVVFVTWHDACSYAAWAVKSLPTSQQWEKAAREARGAIYPWGDQPTPAKCNVREAGVGATTPVDRYASGVSPYGLYDMCGNVWEWCVSQTEPGRHELKGSAFTSPFQRTMPSLFNDASAHMSDDDTGFRCVAPVEAVSQSS